MRHGQPLRIMMTPPEMNLILAWVWITLGFISGLALGLFFHREGWLGGYASHPRRLLRLGHISFFGTGLVNLCFYLTVGRKGFDGLGMEITSWSLVVGAVTMPLCCLILAFFPRNVHLFSVPVISLLLGAICTVISLVKQDSSTQLQANPAAHEVTVSLAHARDGGSQ